MPFPLSSLKPSRFGFKAAIFDFDGTLADSHGIWAKVDRIFFSRRGLDYGPEYAEQLSIFGFEDGARYTIQTYGLTDSVQDICDEWNQLGSELYRTDVELFPHALTYVQSLQSAGIRTALATTNHPDVLLSMEPRVPIQALFPTRVHGCEVPNHTKADPDIYLEACRRLGVDPVDCVLFEDLPTGLRTGKDLGFTCVGFISGDARQDIQALQSVADLVLPSWKHVLD